MLRMETDTGWWLVMYERPVAQDVGMTRWLSDA